MVILVDDEDRENEGDLCMAAEKITPEAINFMAKYGRGLICLSLAPQRVEELKLPMMTDETIPSALHSQYPSRQKRELQPASRQRTGNYYPDCQPEMRPDDPARPGHIFPLRARSWGSPANRPDRRVCGSCKACRPYPAGDMRDNER